ncbi:MAG: hypothetical protein RL375_4298 [Pseudomonadota bacterium]
MSPPAALEADHHAAAAAALSPVLGEPSLALAASDIEKQAWAQLDRLQGAGERRAVMLALLLTPDSPREEQAWAEECQGVMLADTALTLVRQLRPQAQPSAFERVLGDSKRAPQGERVALLRAARRLMCADGRVGPLDRLRWLYMRQCLADGEPGIGAEVSPATAPADLESRWAAERNDRPGASALPEIARLGTSRLTAYLARMVPVVDPQSKVGALGVTWHRSVLRELWGDDVPACRPPDSDQLVHALAEVQSLSWMQRPILARTWIAYAFALARRRPAPATDPATPARAAADADSDGAGPPAAESAASAAPGLPDMTGLQALRLACRMIDAPLPPELARMFVEHPQAVATA